MESLRKLFCICWMVSHLPLQVDFLCTVGSARVPAWPSGSRSLWGPLPSCPVSECASDTHVSSARPPPADSSLTPRFLWNLGNAAMLWEKEEVSRKQKCTSTPLWGPSDPRVCSPPVSSCGSLLPIFFIILAPHPFPPPLWPFPCSLLPSRSVTCVCCGLADGPIQHFPRFLQRTCRVCFRKLILRFTAALLGTE